MRPGRHSRNVEMPEDWRERIDKATAELQLESSAAFIRLAIQEKLAGVASSGELRAIEERQAATLEAMRIAIESVLAACQDLAHSVQGHMAFQDAFAKQVLTYLPDHEPTGKPGAIARGRARYESLIDHAAKQVNSGTGSLFS